MAPVLTRRTLAKGAAWSVPVVVAASAVPALAASTSNEYRFSGSFAAQYYAYGSARCSANEGVIDTLSIDTAQEGDELEGFGVITEDDSEETTATVKNFSLTWAFPEGMVEDFDITSGSYSGPTVGTYTTNGKTYDTFTFTWEGDDSAETDDSFPDSYLEATAELADNYCVSRTSANYYFHPSGSWSTENGVSGTLSTDWIERTMTND